MAHNTPIIVQDVVSVIDVVDQSEAAAPAAIPIYDYRAFTNALQELKKSPSASTITQILPFLSKDKYRKQMRVEGGLLQLITLLSMASGPTLSELQRAALKCLALCCRNLPTREELRRKNGIAVVFKILNETWQQHSEDALYSLQILREVSLYDKNRQTVRQTGLIELICCHLLPAGIFLTASFEVLTALSSSPADEASKSAISAAGGVEHILAAILQDGAGCGYDGSLRCSAIGSLAAVAPGSRNIQAQARKFPRAIDAISDLLADPIEENRRVACLGVAALCEGDFSNQAAFERCGTVDRLMQLLIQSPVPTNKPETQRDACSALSAMAHGNVKIQSLFRTDGGVRVATLIQCAGGHGALPLDASFSVASSNSCLFGVSPEALFWMSAIGMNPFGLPGSLPLSSSSSSSATPLAVPSIPSPFGAPPGGFIPPPLASQSGSFDGAGDEEEESSSKGARLVGLRVQAINSLNEIAKDSPANCDLICNSPAGAISALVAAIQPNQHKLLQYAACSCIDTLTRKNAKRAALFKTTDAVSHLKSILASGDERTKKGAKWALEALV